MLILIDNYDSFTYNLVHYFEEIGQSVKVFRNDEISVEKKEDLKKLKHLCKAMVTFIETKVD